MSTQAVKVTAMTNPAVKARTPGWVPDVDSLGARLALVRHAMGWNIAEAATNCGLPIASWRNWESRGKEPRGVVSVCMKVAGVTGVDLNWLLMGPAARQLGGQPLAKVTTPEYVGSPLGERVVAVGSDDRMTFRNRDLRAITRTRPIRR